MMEDGPLAEWAFETAEGSLDSCQQDIVAPDVFGTQVVAAAFEQVTAIEGFGFLFALLVFAPGELGLLLVVVRAEWIRSAPRSLALSKPERSKIEERRIVLRFCVVAKKF